MNTLNRFEKRKHRTRNQLKQYTMELLLEKGYADLTIQDITDRADLARGTFYVHFGDKDEIIWSLLRDSMDGLVEETLHGLNDVPYLERKYRIWLEVFTYGHENRDLLRVLLGDKGHPAFSHRLQNLFAEVVEKGMVSGVFRPQMDVDVPVIFMAQFITGALVRLMLWSIDTDYTPQQLAQMFYEFLHKEPLPPEFTTQT